MGCGATKSDGVDPSPTGAMQPAAAGKSDGIPTITITDSSELPSPATKESDSTSPTGNSEKEASSSVTEQPSSDPLDKASDSAVVPIADPSKDARCISPGGGYDVLPQGGDSAAFVSASALEEEVLPSGVAAVSSTEQIGFFKSHVDARESPSAGDLVEEPTAENVTGEQLQGELVSTSAESQMRSATMPTPVADNPVDGRASPSLDQLEKELMDDVVAAEQLRKELDELPPACTQSATMPDGVQLASEPPADEVDGRASPTVEELEKEVASLSM